MTEVIQKLVRIEKILYCHTIWLITNGLKLLKERALEMLAKYGRTEAQNWPQNSQANKNLYNCITLQIMLAVCFKLLSVALSRLALICNFFEKTYFCHLYTQLPACFCEIHLRFLTSYIYFHLDDDELCKQYQFSNQEMME